MRASCPGHFAQTHHRPDLERMTPVDVLMREALERGQAMAR